MDWLSAAVQGVSNLGASIFNYNSQKAANATNIQLSREQMDFQREMSNTAVQRHAKDLEAAGFNRLLAAGANGASTPSGSAATVKAPEITPVDIIGIQKARADISKTKAETAVADATALNLGEQNENLRSQNALLNAQVELTKEKVKSELISRGYTRVQAAKAVQDMFGTTTSKLNVFGNGATVVRPNMSAKDTESLILNSLQGT
ncbi:MAG: hypothetical protein K2M34_02660 [Alphaproteobacteria bacterium]|nr:hypothetical protein [Alphaproteobacteria bacterium]